MSKSGSSAAKPLAYLPNFTARKVQAVPGGLPADVPDSLAAWATRYLALAVVGVRSEAVTRKIVLHLDRFVAFFQEGYGHDRISACLRRDVLAWQRALVAQGLAPATVNNHLASLSAFTTKDRGAVALEAKAECDPTSATEGDALCQAKVQGTCLTGACTKPVRESRYRCVYTRNNSLCTDPAAPICCNYRLNSPTSGTCVAKGKLCAA